MATAGLLELKLKEAKDNFFDRLAIEDKVEKARMRALSRLGAFIRTRAITSMLGHRVKKGFGVHSSVSNRQGSAPAGQPPNPHTGDIVKQLEFVYDKALGSVVVGPAKLNKPGGKALEVLEHGGDELLEMAGKVKQAHYAGNPFMAPALEAEQANVEKLWANSVVR